MRLKIDNIGISRKSVKSIGFLGVSNLMGQSIGFVTSIVLALILTKNEYGYFRYVIGVGNFIVMCIAAGYSGALTRFISAERDKKDVYFSMVMVIEGFVFVILFVIFLIFSIDILIYLAIIGYSVSLIYYGVIRGFIDYKKMAAFTVLRFLFKFLLILPIFFLSFLKLPLYVIGVYSFGGWIGIILLEIWKRTDIHLSFKGISKGLFFDLSRFSLFSVLTNIFFSSFVTVGIVVLEWHYGYRAVADYSMAITFAMIYTFVPGAINALLMPKVAKLPMYRRIKVLKQSVFFALFYVILLYLLVVLFGLAVLKTIFGDKYIGAYGFLLVVSIGTIAGAIAHTFAAFFSGTNKPQYNAIAFGVGAGINFILANYLIGIYNEMGVAWSYSVSFLIVLFIDLAIFQIKIRSKM